LAFSNSLNWLSINFSFIRFFQVWKIKVIPGNQKTPANTKCARVLTYGELLKGIGIII